MKVLALVGSPRKGGNTDILAEEFLRGAREAGADSEEKREMSKRDGRFGV